MGHIFATSFAKVPNIRTAPELSDISNFRKRLNYWPYENDKCTKVCLHVLSNL